MSVKYRPDIDGLRALAVLGVIFFHAFPTLLTGGFVGVDVFFVISGYLISGIILDQRAAGTFSIREFYFRRIRRIFPGLMVVLAATFCMGWVVLFSDEFSRLGRQVAAGAGFAANILFWRESGYFDQSAELKPLLHLWSLGVEEQFYFVWPFLLLLFGATRRKLAVMFAAVFAASMALSLHYYFRHHAEAAFYMPYFRLWEFVAGASVILLNEGRAALTNRLLNVLSVAGLALLALSMVCFNNHTPYPGCAAIMPVLGTALIIYAGPMTWVNRVILSHRLVVGIGLISYPLYLWHWPFISYLHVVNITNPWLFAASLELSLLLAWLTYTILERPIRKTPAARVAPGLGLACLLLFLAGAATFTGHVKPRLNFAELNNIIAARNDWQWPPPGMEKSDILPDPVYILKGTRPEQVLYIGDSNMEQYAPRITSVIKSGKPTYTAVFLTQSGCMPIPNATQEKGKPCLDVESDVLNYIQSHNVKKIVMAGRWNPGLSASYLYYRFPDGEYVPLTEPRAQAAAVESFKSFVAKLRARPIDVTILQNIPSSFDNLEALNMDKARLTLHDPQRAFAAFDAQVARSMVTGEPSRAIISNIANETGAHVIDPVPVMCGPSSCPLVYDGGHYVYKDNGHLASSYAAHYASFMDGTILAPPQ